MKPALILLSLGAVLVPSLTLAQGASAHYRNKNRVLLIFAPGKSDPRWQEQDHLLEKSTAAFRGRDLIRLDDLEAGGTKSTALRTRYHVKPGQFRVILLGKDGHIASEGLTPIRLDELSDQIDRMPMRREEIKKRGR